MVKMFDYSFWQNTRAWQTDRRIDKLTPQPH